MLYVRVKIEGQEIYERHFFEERVVLFQICHISPSATLDDMYITRILGLGLE
jgi:hypothetical protein